MVTSKGSFTTASLGALTIKDVTSPFKISTFSLLPVIFLSNKFASIWKWPVLSAKSLTLT